MEIYVIGSGSNGNATLIVNKNKKILIDCGVGIRNMKERLSSINVNIDEIDTILITHEHVDHIKSLKYFKNSSIYGGCDIENIIPLKEFETINLNGFNIFPIPLSHDASLTLGYIISDENETLVYITDTGYLKNKFYQYISNKEHYIIESNYDVNLLINSSRPQYLINRIMSNKGHLGNIDCASIMKDLIGNNTKTITLAHISDGCNNPKIALDTFKEIMDENFIDISNISLKCASRKKLVTIKGSE